MITRQVHFSPSTTRPSSLTPETSPELSPVVSDWDADDEANMSPDDLMASRPISIAIPSQETALSPTRPTLDDILNERSQPPYTLSAFTAYLSQQHCLETLEFTMEAKQYQEKYAKAAAHLTGMPMSYDHVDAYELQRSWVRILDLFIKPGSPREINLSAEVRDDLLDQAYLEKPPLPEALGPAVRRMYDLMSDSIFMPFLNSFNPAPRAMAFTAPESDFEERREGRSMLSTSLLEDRGNLLNRQPSRRRRSPQSSPSFDFPAPKSLHPARSHRHTHSSSTTSYMGPSSGSRVSTRVSNSSTASGQDGGLTDDSGSADSPGAGDPMTPPTTPPGSDLLMGSLHGQHSPKPDRSDSGSWRKLGLKVWGKKRSGGTLRERPDEG